LSGLRESTERRLTGTETQVNNVSITVAAIELRGGSAKLNRLRCLHRLILVEGATSTTDKVD
jgi:hypothetical protein